MLPERLKVPLCIFGLSAAVLIFELSLLRALQVAYWYHFAGMVIGTALLGYGVSGTLLMLPGERLRNCSASLVGAVTFSAGAAVLLCFRIAQTLPIDLMALWQTKQLLLVLSYHLLLLIPFLLAGFATGLAIILAGRGVGSVYGASLAGSGTGGLVGLALLNFLPAERAVDVAAVLAAVSGTLPCWRPGIARRLICAAAAVSVVVAATLWPVSLRISRYKPLWRFRELAKQGQARHIATAHSTRARADLFDVPSQHKALFAGLLAPVPPRQWTILLDGAVDLPVLLVSRIEDAGIVEHTLMYLPYALLGPEKVLVLGDVSGFDTLLAVYAGARRVTVVTNYSKAVNLIRAAVPRDVLDPFSLPAVNVVFASPRSFLAGTGEKFDLVHIASAESMPAGSHGLMAATSDYLLTVESLERCLDVLSPNGSVSLTRGMQMPPRDNLRILSILAEAVRRAGGKPAGQILQVRNYLAVCTLGLARPADAALIGRLRRYCAARGLDLVWHDGLKGEETNRFDRLPGGLILPPGSAQGGSVGQEAYAEQPSAVAGRHEPDPFWQAARLILNDRVQWLYSSYPFDVTPTTDDRPFFYDFFRWRAVPLLRRTYGGNWLFRLEWGYIAVVAGLVETAALAVLLVLLPAIWFLRGAGGLRLAGSVYFGGLGVGFMFVEMAAIALISEICGDPVIAAGLVLSVFLSLSGLGSATVRARPAQPHRAVDKPWFACLAAVAAIVALRLVCGSVVTVARGLGAFGGAALGMAAVAPVAFVLGRPFPTCMRLLSGRSAALQGWAWAVNGTASVVAASLAILLAMWLGWGSVWMAAAGAYLAASLAGIPLAGRAADR